MREHLASTLRGTYQVGVVSALLLTAQLPAQIRISAMLTFTGHVTVNGSSVPPTTAVVPGDRIETARDGAAALSLPGSAVTLSANSRVVFRGEMLELQNGTAGVNTSRGLRAQIYRLLVTPAGSSPARFEVARLDDSTVITAEAGSLTLTGAGNTTLEQGKSAIVRDGGVPQVVLTASRKSMSSKAIAAAGVGGGGAAIASSMATGKRAEDSSPMHP